MSILSWYRYLGAIWPERTLDSHDVSIPQSLLAVQVCGCGPARANLEPQCDEHCSETDAGQGNAGDPPLWAQCWRIRACPVDCGRGCRVQCHLPLRTRHLPSTHKCHRSAPAASAFSMNKKNGQAPEGAVICRDIGSLIQRSEGWDAAQPELGLCTMRFLRLCHTFASALVVLQNSMLHCCPAPMLDSTDDVHSATCVGKS